MTSTQPESSSSVTLRLKQAELALRRRLKPVLDAEGITFEHWQVLVALLEQPGLRMTDLAEAAALPAATLTRHVDRLSGQALVVRRSDPDDRRGALVVLSEQGERLATRLREIESVASGALRD